MAARKESGAETKRGNDLIRSTRSSGISGIVEAVSGEGRTGRVGFVSMLKERMRDSESGIGAPFVRNGEPPPRFLLMVTRWSYGDGRRRTLICDLHGQRLVDRKACQKGLQLCIRDRASVEILRLVAGFVW